MRLDRGIQRQILEGLAENYPAPSYGIWGDFGIECDAATLLANVTYLVEHGLVLGGFVSRELTNPIGLAAADLFVENETTITAAGLDFLADDGGVSAILNTVTVRIDARQFTELLAARIEELPNLSPEEKITIAGELRKLPAKGAEKAIDKILDWVVDHAAEALPLLRALPGIVGG